MKNEDRPAGALTRRDLMRAGAIGGALAAAGPLFGSVANAANTARTAEPAARTAPTPFELDETTIASLQEAMKSGRHTARSILEAYLNRIEELNHKGPELRAVIETNPEALALADALDAERKAKGPRGPLHGIPVLLKDNIGTHDRMTTTAGSLALEGSIPPRDAFLAARLREAGAVLLGKANLSEWANFRSTHSSSGWSSRGRQCRNPYALDRCPSGSSSGSAVAAAANLAAVTVGSETDGSIISPSSICGVVGIKPTLGLISRAGVIPIAHSQDTAGPICRTVTDAAILLGAMTGLDERDEATLASRGKALTDYAKFLDPAGLKGAKLGIFHPKSLEDHPHTSRVLAESIAALRSAGARVIDPVKLPAASQLDEDEFEVLLFEFKADLNRYLADLGAAAPVHSLKEAIDFNAKNRDRVMPYFGQEIFEQAEARGPLTDEKYRKALDDSKRISRQEGLDAAFADLRLDAVVAISGGPAWLIDLINGDSETGGSSQLAAISGYPSITVPAGYALGMPIGLSFIGPAWSEPKLIKLAYAFEQATKVRKAPRFLATAELG